MISRYSHSNILQLYCTVMLFIIIIIIIIIVIIIM